MLTRYIAIAAGLYLAYTAYRCPCEEIYACKPVTTNAAALTLAAIAAYPVFLAQRTQQ